MTRHEERELAEVRDFWRDNMRDRLLDLARPGGGVACLFTNEEYEPWHRFWTHHADSVAGRIKNIWPLDPEIGSATDLMRNLVACTTGDTFRGWLLGHTPPTPTMHVAEYYVRAVDATLSRYAAKVAADRANEPTLGQRIWAWIASRPDWIETHPRTLLALLILLGLVLAVQAPELFRSLTELVRALRGQSR